MQHFFLLQRRHRLLGWADGLSDHTEPLYVAAHGTTDTFSGFSDHLASYGGFGWFLSFIPGTQAHKARKQYSALVYQYEQKAHGDYASEPPKSKKLTPLERSLYFFAAFTPHRARHHTYLQKPWKIALAFCLGILFTAICLTGIGALFGVGFIGSTLLTTVIGKGLTGAAALITSHLSTVTTIALTAISGFFASLSFREALSLSSVRETISNVLFFAGLRINLSLWQSIPFIGEAFGDVYYSLSEKLDLFLQDLLNPVRVVRKLLTLVQNSLLKICQIGATPSRIGEATKPLSWPRRLPKTVIAGAFALVFAPLQLIEFIAQLPYRVLKFTLYTLPKNIGRSLGRAVGKLPPLKPLVEAEDEQFQAKDDESDSSHGNTFYRASDLFGSSDGDGDGEDDDDTCDYKEQHHRHPVKGGTQRAEHHFAPDTTPPTRSLSFSSDGSAS